MVLTPVAQAGIADGRGRFREIFCAVLGARSRTATAALSCDQALVRLDDEPSGTGAPVDLAASRGAFTVVYVLGLWSDCADQTLRARTEMNDYLARFGFHLEALKVSGISGTRHNAHLIRDALEAEPELGTTRRGGTSPYAVIRQLADQSAFPRAEMLEAALRFIEEDLRAGASTP